MQERTGAARATDARLGVRTHPARRSARPEEFVDALRQALIPPSRGVIFWSWQALEDEPEKKALLRRLVRR